MTIASGKPSHMVDSGCCSRLFDPVRALRILLLDVLGLGSLHQKHPDALFSRRCKSRQVQYFQTGFLDAGTLLRRFSVLLPHQADFEFVQSTVVAKRSHFAEVLSLVTVFWSLFLLMERDELGVSPSPHECRATLPSRGGWQPQLLCHLVPCFRAS